MAVFICYLGYFSFDFRTSVLALCVPDPDLCLLFNKWHVKLCLFPCTSLTHKKKRIRQNENNEIIYVLIVHHNYQMLKPRHNVHMCQTQQIVHIIAKFLKSKSGNCNMCS